MGKIYEKDAFLLRSNIGTAGNADKGEFEMSLVNGVIPAVKSDRTGRTFTLSWEDIINQAIEAGILEEPQPGNIPK